MLLFDRSCSLICFHFSQVPLRLGCGNRIVEIYPIAVREGESVVFSNTNVFHRVNKIYRKVLSRS